MDSPLNSSARFSSATSAATVCLHGSPRLKTCNQLHIWKPLVPMTTIWVAFDSWYIVHDFNHCIDWHVFNEPRKREQRCCSEHGRVSQISCHSLVRDLTTHAYVVVCLLYHAFEEARGVCTRRQRDSGVSGTPATFGNQFLRATIANMEGA